MAAPVDAFLDQWPEFNWDDAAREFLGVLETVAERK
jgi:hypothetical protein